MAVEVLLMADVKDLGGEGAIVKVADGYARNYLFPKKLAAPVTEGTRRRLAKMREEREKVRHAEAKSAKELAARIQAESYSLPVKTGVEDKMYGSVTAADLAELLNGRGIKVDRHQIVLDNPIKELGVYEVAIRLHPDVQATMKLWIVEE